MRSLTIILLCIAWSVGCADLRKQAEKTQALRQAHRDKTYDDLQSLVGKTIVSVDGPEKPLVVTLDDGRMLTVDATKYALRITVIQNPDDATQ